MRKNKDEMLFLLPSLASGGAENFLTRLLIEMKKNGHVVNLFLIDGAVDNVGQDMLDKIEEKNINVSMPNSSLFLKNIIRLIYFIYKINPYFIMTTGYKADIYAIFSRLIMPFKNIKYISRLTSTKPAKEIRLRVISRLRYYFFHYIVACSKSIHDSLPKKYIKKTTIIANGINPSYSRRKNFKSELRSKHNLKKTDFIFINVGSFRSEIPGGGGGLEFSQKG